MTRASDPGAGAPFGALRGHLWTVVPRLRDAIRPPRGPADRPWSTTLLDPLIGPVRLTGRFHGTAPHPAARLLVIVHGLGGSADSPYARRVARVAAGRGWAVLRLNLRGCDRLGEDIYHGGLTLDLDAALSSPEAAPFEHVAIFGVSLGGHLALRFVAEAALDRAATRCRVKAAAAVCAPLDLGRSGAAIDQAGGLLYRTYLLRHLREILAPAARRNPRLPRPEQVARVRTLRHWDGLVVAPRFGFESADDYYQRASVAPLLARLSTPALLVQAVDDPMVTAESVRPALRHASTALEVRWARNGGHVGMPDDLDLGEAGPRGLEGQVLTWLEKQIRGSHPGGEPRTESPSSP